MSIYLAVLGKCRKFGLKRYKWDKQLRDTMLLNFKTLTNCEISNTRPIIYGK